MHGETTQEALLAGPQRVQVAQEGRGAWRAWVPTAPGLEARGSTQTAAREALERLVREVVPGVQLQDAA